MFFKLKNFTWLGLACCITNCHSSLKISVNETVPNFEVLGLASCNLSKFPIIEVVSCF